MFDISTATNGYWTIDEEGLTATYIDATGSSQFISSIPIKARGKLYFEIDIIGTATTVGIGIFIDNKHHFIYADRGSIYNPHPSESSYSSGFSSGTIGVSYDTDSNKINFYYGGTWKGERVLATPVTPSSTIRISISRYYQISVKMLLSNHKYPVPSGHTTKLFPNNRFILKSESNEEASYINVNSTKGGIATPIMTSNIAPSGRCFASSIYNSAYDAWYAFNRKEDNEGYASVSGSGGSCFLGYDFIRNEVIIDSYSLKVGKARSEFFPKSWTFEGSNDDVNWTILDTIRAITWSFSETKTFKLKKSEKYRLFRVKFTENNGGVYTSLDELYLNSPDIQTLQVIEEDLNIKDILRYGKEIKDISNIKFDTPVSSKTLIDKKPNMNQSGNEKQFSSRFENQEKSIETIIVK